MSLVFLFHYLLKTMNFLIHTQNLIENVTLSRVIVSVASVN